MDLVPYSEEYLALTEALECDPEVMKELGGPRTKDQVAETHKMRVETVARGEWWFVIVPDPSSEAVGATGIWERDWRGSRIHEIGWMLLPAHQGKGLASAAVELLLSRARSDPRYERIHAFPGATNAPSNALCRKFGFSLVEECEVDYSGRTLRVNHWELALPRAKDG